MNLIALLEVFVTAAECLNFTSAAARLNTEQPRVSEIISDLEEELGRELFTRRPVTLTEFGRAMLPYACDLVNVHRQMAERAQHLQSRGRRAPPVRIGLNEAAAHTWWPGWHAQLHVDCEGVDIELLVDTTAGLEQRAAIQQLDLCVCTRPVGPPEVLHRPLPSMAMAFVGGPRHADKQYSLKDLAAGRILSFQRDSIPAQEMLRILAAQDLSDAPIDWLSSIDTMIRAVQRGIGVATLPEAVVAACGPDTKLKLLRCDVRLPELRFWLSVPNASKSEQSQKVIDSFMRFADQHLT
jgi:DNA-binding transcriptional LysR family regulator